MLINLNSLNKNLRVKMNNVDLQLNTISKKRAKCQKRYWEVAVNRIQF